MEYIKISNINSYININDRDLEIVMDLKLKGDDLSNENLKEVLSLIKKASMDKYLNMDSYGDEITFQILKKFENIENISIVIKEDNTLGKFSYLFEREKTHAFIGIGSNMGERKKNVENSISMINSINGVKLIKESNIIETKAWGYEEQNDFMNCVIEIESILSPEDLLINLQKIEKEMKRVRAIKWGPRIIDLDILFIDQKIIYEENLIVPHPYVHKRDFVLKSLVEIAPHFIHPLLNKSIEEIYEELNEI